MTTKKLPKVDLESAIARAKKAGLTLDELREVEGGSTRPQLIQRIRTAGLTLEEVNAICYCSRDLASLSPKTADKLSE